jgi:probable rRNA maturation factor
MAAGSDISVAFVGEKEMERLHVQWLDEPGPTDVMSFPMDELVPGDERAGSLGDVVICGSVAARQAQAAGHSIRDEVELLFTHGVLHLLGHDHQEPAEHEVMFGLQADLLKSWREENNS